jgi:ABC-type transporter Mla subunit MlaD
MEASRWRRGWVAVAAALGAAALVVILLLATSAGGGGGYSVRAIFDDAANLIGGEDVKIAGVKVGTVGSVTPTPQAKAAVVLNISNPGFQDFRVDASCTIRPQALIGEKYVDCLPTQPRVEGTPLPPPLPTIPSGREGEGQHLLPVQNTHSPVDIDLLGDINRLPERQRFTIILNEFGAGLAGRGSDLNVVIRRANPALQELDKVLAILASENKVLVKLAEDSDKALAPLAAVRNRVANYIVQSNTVAQATAAHRAALQSNLALFPPFLEQLGPASERLGRLADQEIPVFRDLGIAAPSINKAFATLPAFSNSSSAFFQSLGRTAQKSGPALVATQPLLNRLQKLGRAANPTATSLSELLTSLRETGGLERIMDFIFLSAGSTNGYDRLGHFLRAEGIANQCISYFIEPKSGCSAKLFNTRGVVEASEGEGSVASAADARPSGSATTVMARTLALLNDAPAGSSAADATEAATRALSLSAGGTRSVSSPAGSQASGMLLNYLLGN